MGHLASRPTRRGSGLAGVRIKMWFPLITSRPKAGSIVTIFALVGLGFATVVVGQSGRNKEKAGKPAPAKNRSTPISETNKSPTASSRASSKEADSRSQSRPRKSAKDSSSEDVDPSDTVRVISNLVPIPASVVDQSGFAISGLNLEDFELRVDGTVKPISDMTRAETSVRLAMLFDNSGSLDKAREFEPSRSPVTLPGWNAQSKTSAGRKDLLRSSMPSSTLPLIFILTPAVECWLLFRMGWRLPAATILKPRCNEY